MEIPFILCIIVNIGIGVVILLNVLRKVKENNKTLTQAQTDILQRHLPFYLSLEADSKVRFNHRVALFIEFHEFSGREGMEINEEMKVAIAGAGVHLTFGMDDFLFGSFQKIYVYPAAYYSPFSKTMNKGETNPHGIIAFSWPHFIEGFETVTDKINLGYHEFAHALLLQESQQELNDTVFVEGYHLFSVAMEHFKIAKHAYQLDFLRKYAFTNKMEFFAVCAEQFMEAPEVMYEKFPGLYELMTRMLRTDPVNKRTHLCFNYNYEFTVESLLSNILEREEPY